MAEEIYNVEPSEAQVRLWIQQSEYAEENEGWWNDDLKPYRWHHALRDRFLCWWRGV